METENILGYICSNFASFETTLLKYAGLTVFPFCSGLRVTQSKNPDYPVGSEWLCKFGWRTHTVCNPSTSDVAPGAGETDVVLDTTLVKPAPDIGDLPKSLTLGALGMPG